MIGRRATSTSTALAMTGLAIGVIVGPSVLAGAADEETVISACVSTSTGAVRIVATDEQCHPNESTFQWNQAGPPGPAGPAGPPGPEGPTGPGLTGIERVSAESAFDSEAPKTMDVACPAGKIVLTGGARIASSSSFPPSAAAYLTWSAPLVTTDQVESTSWAARGDEPTPSDRDWSVVVWVWCIDDPTP